jgi:hypothetical protein
MAVELWEERYGNAIEEFPTVDAALSFVQAMILQHGEESVATWALDISDDTPPVRGRELVERAKKLPA